ncbi:DUF5655 domain-containing protein [Pseudolysinimonas sp.]
MVASTWEVLTEGLDADDLAKLTAFRDACRILGGVEERVHSSEIAFAGKRVFASAYIKSHYLELGIELTREVTRPKPRTAFPTTKRFIMHRYSLRELEDFTPAIRKLLTESYETVGPGSR